jgi:hypothetical protein
MFGNGYLTREERIGLSSAIGDALTAFNESVASNLPHLYERDPYADPDRASVDVTEAAERRQTKEGTVPNEDRLKALEESMSALTTKQAETETKLGEAETRATTATTRAERAEETLAEMRADQIVRKATIQVEGAKDPVSAFHGLKESAVERCVKAALADKLPLTEAGKLDEEKLTERAVKAAKEERDYLAEHGGGGGQVAGFGSTTVVTEADGAALAAQFGRLGLDDKAAKVAANGR